MQKNRHFGRKFLRENLMFQVNSTYFLNCILQFKGSSSGPKKSLELASEAFYAASNATSLFHNLFNGPEISWKTLSQVDHAGGEFSRQNAESLGQIKTNLLNAIDYYDSASQSVYEWSSYAPSTLQHFIQFFNVSDPSAATNQRKLLLRILENGSKKLGKGQKDFGDILSALNLALKDLRKLLDQLKIDYSPNSLYFESRVKKIVDSQSSGWLASKPDKAKIVADLIGKFKPILDFYEKLTTNVQRVDELLNKSSAQITKPIQLLDERRQQIKDSGSDDDSRPAPADTLEPREATINAAQVLIAVCQDYRNARA